MIKTFEVEQKYRITNPAVIRKRLKILGAKRIARGLEKNEIWDLGNLVRRKASVLRLRTHDGKGTLTFKGPRLKSKFKKRLEVESEVHSGPIRTLLNLLGFKVIAQYKKEREEYRLGSAHVTLDHLGRLGWFVEIEAAPKHIEKIAAKLGLASKDREERSYLEMIYGNRKSLCLFLSP